MKTTTIDPHGYTGGSRAWEPGHLAPTFADAEQLTAAALANLWAWPRWVSLSEPQATAP